MLRLPDTDDAAWGVLTVILALAVCLLTSPPSLANEGAADWQFAIEPGAYRCMGDATTRFRIRISETDAQLIDRKEDNIDALSLVSFFQLKRDRLELALEYGSGDDLRLNGTLSGSSGSGAWKSLTLSCEGRWEATRLKA